MQQLGVEMVAACSPQARGRSERAFRTHQDRLVKELAGAGITDMEAANEYIRTRYLPAWNEEFTRPPREAGCAFVPCQDGSVLDNILCEHHGRTVGQDNCVHYARRVLQIPADQHRCHYVRAKVKVLDYPDGTLAIHHGPRELARYDAEGRLLAACAKIPAPGGLPPQAQENPPPGGQSMCQENRTFLFALNRVWRFWVGMRSPARC